MVSMGWGAHPIAERENPRINREDPNEGKDALGGDGRHPPVKPRMPLSVAARVQLLGLPQGDRELTEDPFEAARREVEEETSLRNLDFPWGQVFRETEPYGAGKVARYYLAATQEVAVTLAVSMELGRPEHDEYRWLHYREARALLSARLIAILDWAREVSGC